VELGDSKNVKIEGRGFVAISTNEGNKKHIYDVYYSLKIARNMLSVKQMMKNGYKLMFDVDPCDFIDKKSNVRVAVVKMNLNYLFPFDMVKLQSIAVRCGDVDEAYLWHLRYGNLNIKSLQLLK